MTKPIVKFILRFLAMEVKFETSDILLFFIAFSLLTDVSYIITYILIFVKCNFHYGQRYEMDIAQ